MPPKTRSETESKDMESQTEEPERTMVNSATECNLEASGVATPTSNKDIQSIETVTKMDHIQTTSTTVSAAIGKDGIPELSHKTTNRLNIHEYNGKVKFSSWLTYFEKVSEHHNLDDPWRVRNLSVYLRDEAFDFYLQNGMEANTWKQLKDLMSAYFMEEDTEDITILFQLQLGQCSGLVEYYRKKTILAKKLQLQEKDSIAALNAGLEVKHKNYIAVARIGTTAEWFQVMSQLKSNEPDKKKPEEIKPQPATRSVERMQQAWRPTFQPSGTWRPAFQPSGTWRPPFQPSGAWRQQQPYSPRSGGLAGNAWRPRQEEYRPRGVAPRTYFQHRDCEPSRLRSTAREFVPRNPYGQGSQEEQACAMTRRPVEEEESHRGQSSNAAR